MNLQSFFFITQSIQAIIVTIFFIGLIIFLIYLMVSVKKIKEEMHTLLSEGLEVAEDAKEYINKIGRIITGSLVVRLIKTLIRKKHKKGDNDEG